MPGDNQQITILLDISQRLGVIEGQNQLILQEQGHAREGRNRIHDKLDDMHPTVAMVDRHERDLAELKPKVASLEKERHQAAGVRWLLRSLWAFAGGLVAGLMSWLLHKFG